MHLQENTVVGKGGDNDTQGKQRKVRDLELQQQEQ